MRHITHKQYIHYDFDRDKVPNIDDQKPFDSSLAKPVDKDSSYAFELRKIEAFRKKHEIARQLAQRKVNQALPNNGYVVESRLKSTPSILNKLRRKQLNKIEDVAGVRVVTIGHNRLQKAHEKVTKIGFKKIHPVENYYNKPNKQGKFYKAIHHNVSVAGRPVEIQLKTKRQLRLHDKMHKGYKRGTLTGTLGIAKASHVAKIYHELDKKPSLNK